MNRLATLLTIQCLCFASAVSAQNEDGLLIGNDALATGGAVTANVRDGSAIWYNPAGLARAEGASVDVNGTAFTMRRYRIPGYITAPNGDRADGDITELLIIPSALTSVVPLGRNTRASFGIIVPRYNDLALRASLTTSDGPNEATMRLAFSELSSSVYVGGGLAWRVNDRLRFGVALFGTYSSKFSSTHFWVERETPTSSGFNATTSLSAVSIGGLELRVGVQWQPIERLHIGLSIESPGLGLFEKVDIRTTTGTASVGTDPLFMFDPVDDVRLDFKFFVTTPMRARLGIAYEWNHGSISVDGDIQSGTIDRELGVNRVTTWNLRVGGQLQLSERISGGIGLFTDRSPLPDEREFGRLSADFYGATLAIHYNRTLALAESEESNQVRLSTSLGLRYALGFGEIGTFALDASSDQLVNASSTDVTIHDIAFYIGTALHL